jgi:hypothetical protein
LSSFSLVQLWNEPEAKSYSNINEPVIGSDMKVTIKRDIPGDIPGDILGDILGHPCYFTNNNFHVKLKILEINCT